MSREVTGAGRRGSYRVRGKLQGVKPAAWVKRVNNFSQRASIHPVPLHQTHQHHLHNEDHITPVPMAHNGGAQAALETVKPDWDPPCLLACFSSASPRPIALVSGHSLTWLLWSLKSFIPLACHQAYLPHQGGDYYTICRFLTWQLACKA